MSRSVNSAGRQAMGAAFLGGDRLGKRGDRISVQKFGVGGFSVCTIGHSLRNAN